MNTSFEQVEIHSNTPQYIFPTQWKVVLILLVCVLMLATAAAVLLLVFFMLRKKEVKDCQGEKDELEIKLKKCCSQFGAGGNSYCDGYSVVRPPTGRPVDDIEADDPTATQPIDENEFVHQPFE